MSEAFVQWRNISPASSPLHADRLGLQQEKKLSINHAKSYGSIYGMLRIHQIVEAANMATFGISGCKIVYMRKSPQHDTRSPEVTGPIGLVRTKGVALPRALIADKRFWIQVGFHPKDMKKATAIEGDAPTADIDIRVYFEWPKIQEKMLAGAGPLVQLVCKW